MSRTEERNQEATVYIGNLDERCTEALIWELMLQAGPVVNVHLPKDRVTQTHQNYGFCEYMSEDDADYAIKIMNQIKLYGKPIRVNKEAKPVEVEAEIKNDKYPYFNDEFDLGEIGTNEIEELQTPEHQIHRQNSDNDSTSDELPEMKSLQPDEVLLQKILVKILDKFKSKDLALNKTFMESNFLNNIIDLSDTEMMHEIQFKLNSNQQLWLD
ncbi:1663_t:CDS:2 [Entrophospora sp. SA101]|nr:1663_t:CDS:2 [Entrophospora sp. SA101]